MASLTRTAVIVRKIIRYSFYGIVTLIIARYTYLIGSRIYRSYFPEPPPPPTTKFGRLPELPFPSSPDFGDLIFTLETPEVALPELAPQAQVYFITQPSSSIRALEFAKTKVRSLGFDPEGRELSETVYFFDRDDKPSTLTMNIVTNIFSINYDLTRDESIVYGNPPLPEQAIASAKAYLSRANLLAEDLSGPTTHELLKVSNAEFVQAISLSEADMVKVNLFRKDFGEYPSKTPDPDQANIWFIVGRRGKSVETLLGEYHYHTVDESRSASYPLKTADQAWEELKTGNAYIANFGNNENSVEIKIRRVYLAYYDPKEYTDFFQPIVVFEGDNNFVAYVPAIASDFYGQESGSE
jgi:hypothetical protein